jgi:hypothetical protein
MLSGNPAASFIHNQQDNISNILGYANPPLCSGQSEEICIVSLDFLRRNKVGEDRTRGDGVDGDTLADSELPMVSVCSINKKRRAPYLFCPCERQTVNGGLRGTIYRQHLHSELRSDRGDIDDAAALGHMRHDGFSEKDCTEYVGPEDRLNVLGGNVHCGVRIAPSSVIHYKKQGQSSIVVDIPKELYIPRISM